MFYDYFQKYKKSEDLVLELSCGRGLVWSGVLDVRLTLCGEKKFSGIREVLRLGEWSVRKQREEPWA
jgi:hypothetical protein